jgi:hypothetical protein
MRRPQSVPQTAASPIAHCGHVYSCHFQSLVQRSRSAQRHAASTRRLGRAPGSATQAAIHMHQVLMGQAWKVLKEMPFDSGVYFPKVLSDRSIMRNVQRTMGDMTF